MIYMNSKESLFDIISSTKDEKKITLTKKTVTSFLTDVRNLLLLDYFAETLDKEDYSLLFDKVQIEVQELLFLTKNDDIDNKTSRFMDALPIIRLKLIDSAQSIFDGDPASDSLAEIIQCYPGFQAIFHYRIAHEFYLQNELLLSRMISEEAHQLYGIDIHPGATIGDHFFIDHGTGIVIGETAVIGNNVKLYQGVTLGALSLKEGHSLKGTKRHPTVEDNVTIYSNASIFGGNTIIGKDSTIGANTYLISSVEKNSVVYLNSEGMTITQKKN